MTHECRVTFEDRELRAFGRPTAFIWTRLKLEGAPMPEENWVDTSEMLTPLRRKRLWFVTLGRAGIRFSVHVNHYNRTQTWHLRWNSTAALR